MFSTKSSKNATGRKKNRRSSSKLKTCATIAVTCMALTAGIFAAWWAWYEPDIEYDIQLFQSPKRGYVICGVLKNNSFFKHADRFVFKGHFQNGNAEFLEITPRSDSVERRTSSGKHIEFALNRLSKGHNCGVTVLVSTPAGEAIKEEIYLSWGQHQSARVLIKPPGTKEQQIYNAGLSAEERQKAILNDVAKVR